MENENNDIVVELDGKEYKLRRSFESICKIERALGKSITEIIERLTAGCISYGDLAVIIEAGARAAGHKVTLKEIGAGINAAGISEVAPQLAPFLRGVLRGDEAMDEDEAEETSGD